MPTTYTFEKLTRFATAKTKSGQLRRKAFYQTLNPFNMNSCGDPKSMEEIQKELTIEVAEWIRQTKECE